ncbi:hypothetical protein SNEBB_010098 [Seison nebaliae]|nr:hypothetical protein SNEBB_010098 [Seison nebaliae]
MTVTELLGDSTWNPYFIIGSTIATLSIIVSIIVSLLTCCDPKEKTNKKTDSVLPLSIKGTNRCSTQSHLPSLHLQSTSAAEVKLNDNSVILSQYNTVLPSLTFNYGGSKINSNNKKSSLSLLSSSLPTSIIQNISPSTLQHNTTSQTTSPSVVFKKSHSDDLFIKNVKLRPKIHHQSRHSNINQTYSLNIDAWIDHKEQRMTIPSKIFYYDKIQSLQPMLSKINRSKEEKKNEIHPIIRMHSLRTFDDDPASVDCSNEFEMVCPNGLKYNSKSLCELNRTGQNSYVKKFPILQEESDDNEHDDDEEENTSATYSIDNNKSSYGSKSINDSGISLTRQIDVN